MRFRSSRLMRHACRCFVLCAVAVLAAPATALQAATLYVNNQSGSDAYDGLASQVVSPISGPVRTLCRALQLASPSDIIVLADTGFPYLESVTLSGQRHSGLEHAPFVIEGNGAILSGAEPIPLIAWQRMGGNLWKVTPVRKGIYQLMLGAETAPEIPCPPDAPALPEIPPGHWCSWRGSIYFQAELTQLISNLPLAMAARDVGLTLLDVRHVQVRNLTIHGFRLDGINAFDGCDFVEVENVTCQHNGRAGMVVGGTSHITVRNAVLAENRRYQMLIRGLGAATLEDSQLSEPPHVENE
jgi:hypothetical protein